MTQDAFGNYARWDRRRLQVLAGGSGPGEVSIYTAPAGQTVTDLAMGYDGILYIAVGGTLVMVDRRGRWPNFTLIGWPDSISGVWPRFPRAACSRSTGARRN